MQDETEIKLGVMALQKKRQTPYLEIELAK
jgi:hypothetical protein